MELKTLKDKVFSANRLEEISPIPNPKHINLLKVEDVKEALKELKRSSTFMVLEEDELFLIKQLKEIFGEMVE